MRGASRDGRHREDAAGVRAGQPGVRVVAVGGAGVQRAVGDDLQRSLRDEPGDGVAGVQVLADDAVEELLPHARAHAQPGGPGGDATAPDGDVVGDLQVDHADDPARGGGGRGVVDERVGDVVGHVVDGAPAAGATRTPGAGRWGASRRRGTAAPPSRPRRSAGHRRRGRRAGRRRRRRAARPSARRARARRGTRSRRAPCPGAARARRRRARRRARRTWRRRRRADAGPAPTGSGARARPRDRA